VSVSLKQGEVANRDSFLLSLSIDFDQRAWEWSDQCPVDEPGTSQWGFRVPAQLVSIRERGAFIMTVDIN
jgi:hypothetical protein